MFRIKDIIMANFSRFEGVVVPIEGETTVFTGPNGSGKSTTFDAVRLVLGSHKYANEKRDLSEYLRNPHAYTVLAIIAYNRRADGKPAIFRKLGLRSEFITLARVYLPKAQGRESKFLIVDGEINDSEILDRIERGEGLGETVYMGKLATIGITLATLDQLIIRQGKVIEITNLSPNKLHKKVMDHAGASATMTDYTESRKKADEAALLLDDRKQEHRAAKKQLQELEDEQERKRRYDDKKAEIQANEHSATAAKIQVDLRKIASKQTEIPDLEATISELTQARTEAKEAIRQQTKIVEEATGSLKAWDAVTQEIADEKAEIDAKKQKIESSHARLVVARTELPKLKDLPVTREAATEAERLSRIASEALAKETAARSAFDEANARHETLKRGETAWPARIATVLQALDAAKIKYACLAHALDPSPEDKPALEAALGNRRYAIEVPEPHFAKAIALAREHEFPGPIYTSAHPRSQASSVWNAGGATPSWLAGFNVKNGLAISPEGTWLAHEQNTVLGAAPTKAQVEGAKIARDVAEKAHREAARARGDADEAAAEARNVFVQCRARDEHQAIIRNAGDLPERFNKLAHEHQRLTLALLRREEDKTALQASLDEAKGKLSNIKEQDGKRAARLHSQQMKLDEARELVRDLSRSTELALMPLPDEWKQKASDLNTPLGEAETYKKRAERLQRELKEEAEPDPEVDQKTARVSKRVKELERRVNEQLETVHGTIQELERSRRQYAVFASQHLENFATRLYGLAKDFGVSCSIHYTPITQKSSDQEIDNAVLDVRMGYNKKEPTLVSQGGFSGGEDIINGLLLQLALREVDADGFIMVDQPYDHLDSSNAREIAEHLANAPMQVIIAVPSSLSPETYHGMARAILFQQAQGTDWAPLPEVVAVRGS